MSIQTLSAKTTASPGISSQSMRRRMLGTAGSRVKCIEAIPYATHGSYADSTVLELGAQPRDMDLHGIRREVDAPAPQALHQAVLAYHARRIEQHIFQDRPLAWGKLERAVAEPCTAPLEVHPQ